MTGFHWLVLIPAVAVLATPSDVAAQGRGKSQRSNSGGPAFCRSGAGHPVHGWEWCRQKGWDRAAISSTPGTAIRRDRERQGAVYSDRNRSGRQFGDVAFDNGYADGYEKGLDDARDGRDRNPTRHAWYRSADCNYDAQYGSRATYANVYREGFRSGYDEGFNDGERYGDPGGFRWPF